ncbi:MAG: family 20 glycosylhydrolase [Acidobacteriota bacterium]|nr:family 20 glycosylhydrolase [Acidobacteriota bacterium]
MENKSVKLIAASFLLFALVICLEGVACAQTKETAGRSGGLMPVPSSVRDIPGRLAVTGDFRVSFVGNKDPRLERYVSRVLRRIEGRTVLELPRDFAGDSGSAALVIEARAAGKAVPELREDESYSLKIDETQARLTAPTSLGAMRGLETLLQLLQSDSDGFFLPAVDIEDKPRFPWRGLMIDSARHFQPMEVLKRNLDGMAAVKLNVFHWHLTEDQGFRVESRKFPKLHGLGSDGLFYTQEEIKEIIEYAADRGIRVVPEFDMPGHATAWLVGHPELGSAPGPYTIERNPGIFDPTMDPTKETTYEFLAVFLAEMAGLFPDAYIHIGGDENEGKQWDANPDIQAFMKEKGLKDNHELQNEFNKRVLAILKKHGKTMMGWDEIFQPDLPQDVVIHSWRGQEALAEAARKGYFGVLSNGYYIDLMYPASDHYLVDPVPAGTTLSVEEQKRVLGGEATMWSEWVSPETIDSRIWPRTAGIAERLWSAGSVNDVDDMYRRLEIVSIQLEEHGLTHRRNRRVMLRRLLQSNDTADLERLVSLIEPVKQYQRYQQRKQTMLSPLTGLIDAAGADAPGAREFRRLVREKLKARSVKFDSELRVQFISWQGTGTRLEQTMANAAALHEAKGLAGDLRKMGEIGIEALEHLADGDSPAGWRETTLSRLKEISKPKAALEFAVIKSLEELVKAASENKPGSKTSVEN